MQDDINLAIAIPTFDYQASLKWKVKYIAKASEKCQSVIWKWILSLLVVYISPADSEQFSKSEDRICNSPN